MPTVAASRARTTVAATRPSNASPATSSKPVTVATGLPSTRPSHPSSVQMQSAALLSRPSPLGQHARGEVPSIILEGQLLWLRRVCFLELPFRATVSAAATRPAKAARAAALSIGAPTAGYSTST